MHTRFFPINSNKEIADRHWVIMSECGVYMPEDTPAWLFAHMSDQANARRDRRLKAAKEGLVFHG